MDGDPHGQAQPVDAGRHRHDIQGLRAIAVLIVALNHTGLSFLQGGYVGVDVFFVLSGFLITGLLLNEAKTHGYISFSRFYIRRAKRILPAATLTLVVTMTAAYYLLNYVRAKQAVWDSIWASLFGANIHFAAQSTDYFARGQPPSPVQHYWSLSVEEQFYFVWPALFALALFGSALGRRSARRRLGHGRPGVSLWGTRRLLAAVAILGGASLAWSVHDTDVPPASAYFSTAARAWELALGAGLAIGAAGLARVPGAIRTGLGWLGLGAIGVASVAYSATTAFPGYAALLPTAGAALVIAAGIGAHAPRYGVGCVLSTRPLRYIGDRSYAFYLWHWPVLVIAVQYVGHDLSVAVKLLLLAGAFLLSVISYRLLENPVRRARWTRSASSVLIPASVAAVVVVAMFALTSIDTQISRADDVPAAAPLVTKSHRTTSTRAVGASLPAVVAAVQAARRGAKIPAPLTPPIDKLLDSDYLYVFPDGCVPVADSQTTSEICRLGDTAGAKSIVVFGDSHMQMWMPTILAMAERDGWVVIPIVKSGCVPSSWLGHGFPGTAAAAIRQCHAWYSWALAKAKSLHPDVTVMSGCCGSVSGSTAAQTKQAFIALTKTMTRVSKSVLVLADNEGVNREPVDCLLARHATMKTCTSTWTDERFALNDDLAAVAKAKGFGFLNTRGWFCFEHQCPMVVGHTIVYRDTGHITKPYALALNGPFRTAFRRCILDTCPH
jgi:peptidoglycan/LPS O-acetylase OafA/YrhL